LDAFATDRVVLLSIRPEFAEAILSGTKQVEFRKVPFSRSVRTVIVYATKPVGQIIGTFEVSRIEQTSPTRLWDMFGSVGGVTRRHFRQYFQGRRVAYGIRVENARRFSAPVSLKEVGRGIIAPQSFIYVTTEDASRLLATFA